MQVLKWYLKILHTTEICPSDFVGAQEKTCITKLNFCRKVGKVLQLKGREEYTLCPSNPAFFNQMTSKGHLFTKFLPFPFMKLIVFA